MLERAEDIRQETSLRKIPVLLHHLGRLWRQPQRAEGTVSAAPFDPAPCAQLGKPPAHLAELAHQGGHVLLIAAERGPIHPSDWIVLAIGVVVAALAIADFVSGEQQRHALRQHQTCKQIAPQLPPQLQNLGIISRSFDAVIRAVIFVESVSIVLAVCFVVLALVAGEICKREPIMNRNVVDARARAATVVMKQIG